MNDVTLSLVKQDMFQMLYSLWGINTQNTHLETVPCSQPVTIMRSDITKITNRDYWASPKIDGVRSYMLFSFVDNTDYAVIVNRAGKFKVCHVDAPNDFFCGTLLDGEMIDNAFIVFDCVAHSGFSTCQLPHNVRLSRAKDVIDSCTFSGLEVRVKEWFPLKSSNLQHIMSSCGYKCDGLILMPRTFGTLTPGTASDQFKWKTAAHHTIDMKFSNGKLWLNSWRGSVDATSLSIQPPSEPEGYVNDAIYEFQLTYTENGWLPKLVCERNDKRYPNDVNVARSTLQNILENIQLSELQ